MKKVRLTSLFLRLAGRQNRKGWAMSAAVVAIGGIAITLFSGFLANAASLQTRLDTMISQSSPADVYVTTDPRKGTDAAEADKLEHTVSGIDAIESRFYTYSTLASKNALMVIEPNLPSLGHPYEYPLLGKNHSQEHYFLVNDFLTHKSTAVSEEDAIHVDEDVKVMLPMAGFSLDSSMIDSLSLFLKAGKTNPFAQDNLELHFTITGTMKHLENAAMGTFNPTTFLVSSSYFRDTLRDTLLDCFTETGVRLIWELGFHNKLGWGDGDPYGSTVNFPLSNQFLLKLAPGVSPAETKTKVQAYFANKPANNLYQVQTLDELTSISSVRTELTQAWQLTFVFPVVFFAVALLVILISVRQMILRERIDIGTFKALGINQREIHRHYALKTFILVALGTLAGEIIGPMLVPAILGNKYNILYSLPSRQYVFPVWQCLLAAAVFIGVALLVTYLVSRREIKRKPVESMRGEAPTKKSSSSVGKRKTGFFGLSAKMAGRSIGSDWVRTLMVIVGVMGCTALLCCGYGIEDTVHYGVDTDPMIVSGADITVALIENRSVEKLTTDLNILDENGQPLVYGYQLYSRQNENIRSEKDSYFTTVYALNSYTLVGGEKGKIHFHKEFPVDQVVISEKVARALQISKGETITFNLGEATVTASVFDTLPIFFSNGVYIHADSPLLGASPVKAFNSVWLDAVPGKASELETKAASIPSVAVCDTEVKWRTRVSEVMSSVLVMTNAIKVFAFLLAAVVLYNLGLLNFQERQREIATMKVLGFKGREIMVSLFIETLFLTLIGILLGLAAGFPFTKLVLFINQIEAVDFL